MPIHLATPIPRLSQQDFGEIAYEVMRAAFEVHSELGRCFDEKVYQKALAARIPGAQIELPLEVTFENYRKGYSLDLVVGGAIFETKTVASLTPRHCGQLLNYLLLADAAHGKLINFRADRVQHKSVNSALTRDDRLGFAVEDSRWRETDSGSLRDRTLALLRDWGAGLDTALYEDAVSWLSGREHAPYADTEIAVAGQVLGVQEVRLAASDAALRITAVPADEYAVFESHLRRFLAHTPLRAIQWINITVPVVRFATIERQ